MSPSLPETQRMVSAVPDASQMDDLRALCADPAVMRYVGDGRPWDDDKIRAFVERSGRYARDLGCCFWSWFLRDTGEFVGSGGLVPIGRVGPELEVGYRLLPARHGLGLATEIARASLAFAFDHLAQERVLALTHPDNTPSRRVLERVGMREAGMTGEYYATNSLLYAITREQHLDLRDAGERTP